MGELIEDTGYDNMDAVLDNAMSSYPLVEPPASLYRSILHQLPARRAEARPRFRIQWLDIYLGGFAASMFGLLILAVTWIPPQWYPWLNYSLQWLGYQVQRNMLWLLPTLALLLGSGFACLLYSLTRPVLRSKRT
jgi:hypothetical protein